MSSRVTANLPIHDVLPQLRHALAEDGRAVLQAPPGAGKTTGVPLALLDEAWLDGRGILMLEPRRLATRAAARRMSSMLGETVGATVGFRVRGESRVGSSTRVEVVTEGILTRMLLDDPTLERVGLLVFDEFHERSINADVGLALALHSRELLRPDLRVLVMSATLDGQGVAALLDGAPVVTSEGRMFSVERRYLPPRRDARVEDLVASAVRHALAHDDGSVLAFLPGAGEVHRCLARLERSGVPGDVRLFPLYGDLAGPEQDAAIAPAPPGQRKVVLATSIAETSLTIEGVRVVVDGGLSRVPRFSPRTGMSRLETVRVSRSSADQRAGRAGRTSPGIAYRVWPPEEDAHLVDRPRPEILEADLAPLALDLAAAGVADPSELRWIDTPPAVALTEARTLLRQLGALDASHAITPHGRAIASLGLHPRIAHMLVMARDRGLGATASVIAALLDERDLLARSSVVRDADLGTRVAIVADHGRAPGDVDRETLRRVREQGRRLHEALRIPRDEPVDESASGALLALAYPDRVAQRRSGDDARFLLRNGVGAVLAQSGALSVAPFLAVADLDGKAPHARIFLAAALQREEVDELFAGDIETTDVLEWDSASGAVTGVRRSRLGAIVLRESMLRDVDRTRRAHVVLEALRCGDGIALPWSEAAIRLRERVAFLATLDPSWPVLDEHSLLANEDVMLPHLLDVRRRADLEKLPLVELLMERLGWEQRRLLDELAPTHIVVPTGSRIPVDYSDPSAPALSVRLQEMFGLAETPRVGGGRVPVTLHLLSPARRPVQVTRDLAGFWRSSYFSVRKDLRGRYPRHEWPEDPLNAAPTRRAKPRS